MKYIIEASCSSHTGKLRKNNEDNFFFDGKCLEADNKGLPNPVVMEQPLKSGLCLAVFDGMGGENFGELASHAAARCLQQVQRTPSDYFIPERKYLQRLCSQLNEAVLSVKKEMCTNHMGTTLAAAYFSSRYIYVCNLGDSRAYRLRGGEFMQLTCDHTATQPEHINKKAPLNQYLGINPEEMLLEPYIAKGQIKRGDLYLICSDGLTDMVTNFEIADIMLNSADPLSCAEALTEAALSHGGRDNITLIVCKIS